MEAILCWSRVCHAFPARRQRQSSLELPGRMTRKTVCKREPGREGEIGIQLAARGPVALLTHCHTARHRDPPHSAVSLYDSAGTALPGFGRCPAERALCHLPQTCIALHSHESNGHSLVHRASAACCICCYFHGSELLLHRSTQRAQTTIPDYTDRKSLFADGCYLRSLIQSHVPQQQQILTTKRTGHRAWIYILPRSPSTPSTSIWPCSAST